MRPRLSYANVMATIAVFIALGGASYAAFTPPKNSIGSKQLKKNAVTAKKIKKNAVITAKVKDEAITAAKVKKGALTGAQINASTLGTVPLAESAKSAAVAGSLPPAEPWHEVGAPGEPTFYSGWKNVGFPTPTAGFYKDQLGIVHLKGEVAAPSGTEQFVFQLPPGFRPARGEEPAFVGYCAGGSLCGPSFVERIDVIGGDYSVPEFSGDVVAYPANLLSLNQITFRAES
jgi:hypothetical protein